MKASISVSSLFSRSKNCSYWK